MCAASPRAVIPFSGSHPSLQTWALLQTVELVLAQAICGHENGDSSRDVCCFSSVADALQKVRQRTSLFVVVHLYVLFG